MTAPKLPDFNGEPVTSTAIKFTGVGTGFTGLEVRPIVMELDDVAYFVVKVKASESASHKHDKDGNLVRLQRVSAEDMAPISEEVAQQALLAYTREVEKAKADADGQDTLFRDDGTAFQGRSGVHPTARAASDDDEGWGGDDDAEALAEALADDQAADEVDAAEQAALDAEALDVSGTPAEVASAARGRVEGNVIAFSHTPPAGA